MSETSNQNARSLTSAEDLDDDEMPPLSSPVRTSTNTSRRAHRRRPQRTSANHDAGHLSDASMPSLQSVSYSSEAEVMSDSDSEEDVDEGGDDSPPPPLASALPSFANDRLSSLLEQTRPSGRDREDRSTAAEQERFQAAWQHWQSSPTDPHPPNRASQGENVRTDIEDMLNYRSRAANGNNANPINNPVLITAFSYILVPLTCHHYIARKHTGDCTADTYGYGPAAHWLAVSARRITERRRPAEYRNAQYRNDGRIHRLLQCGRDSR